ncbi:MAG: hypothetical protein ACOY45_11460 [Pseudomonadota bacterium]
MNTRVVEATLPSAPDLAGLEPIEKIRRRWPMVLGGALTILMVAGLARELFGDGLGALTRHVPANPLFYIAFALYYLGPPTFDFVIFRKLWQIPMAGMAALHKKRISNEVLLGYSGEAYFYAWARQRTQMVAAPFGAVKDVMILSAIAGNAITLALIGLALVFSPSKLTLFQQNAQFGLWGSVAVIVAMSLPFLLFSKRVFSLPRNELWWVFGVHCLRLVSGSFLIALAWHFALPDVSLGTWLFLAALRMLASRLPFVPNKDLLFANFAIILIGRGDALSELVAFTAALTLLVHITLIGAFGLHALMRKQA